jgi:hypothetical protein
LGYSDEHSSLVVNVQHMSTGHISPQFHVLFDDLFKTVIYFVKRVMCLRMVGFGSGTYPLMQCTNVFFLKADICQLGVDKRKVNMLVREYCDHTKVKKEMEASHTQPSHAVWPQGGAGEGEQKQSQQHNIFMGDSMEEVERKIQLVYCPTNTPAPTSTANPTQTSANEDHATKDDVGEVTEEEDAGRASMHLANDDNAALKSLIFDYIHHIVLSPPWIHLCLLSSLCHC